MHRRLSALVVVCSALSCLQTSWAQEGGRVFCETDEVVGIWEFNDLDVDIFEPVLDDTIIPDLSGNGLDAIVVDNFGGDLIVQDGDTNYDDNTAIERVGGGGAARVTVPDDDDAFEMDEEQDFTFELYVTRAEVTSGGNWGLLAGTWHSRTTIDDAQDGNVDGAWYGWGFIQRGGQTGWLLVVSPTSPDGTVGPLGCCPNEKRNDASWDIPPGSHYVVASFDRVLQVATVYLDGEVVETLSLQPDWSFITPEDHEHANLTFLTGIDDTTRGAFRRPPTGYAIDAARVTRRAMDADEVADNWANIEDSVCSPPQEDTGASLKPGDVNGDGGYNISDPVAELNFLFASGPLPACFVVAGANPVQLTEAGFAILDINGDGRSNIADAVASLNFLFGGGTPPALGDGCAQLAGTCVSNCTQ